MSPSGTYDCVIKSPMGDQRMKLTVNAEGDCFTGTSESAGVSTTCDEGKVDGRNLTWKMKVTQPMPLTLDCRATVDGHSLTGKVKPGMFGEFDLKGTRAV